MGATTTRPTTTEPTTGATRAAMGAYLEELAARGPHGRHRDDGSAAAGRAGTASGRRDRWAASVPGSVLGMLIAPRWVAAGLAREGWGRPRGEGERASPRQGESPAHSARSGIGKLAA